MAKPAKKKTFEELEASARSNDEGQGETIEELNARQAMAKDNPRPQSEPAVRAVTDTYAEAEANRRLPAGRLKPAEGRRNHWFADVSHGTKQADLEKTEFWAHNTRGLAARDEVTVWCEDGSFFAELVVLAVGPKDAKVFVKSFHDLDPIAPDAFAVPSNYGINWAGSLSKFRVQRGSDVIKDGFSSRSEATRWLGNHLGSMTR